MQGISKQMRDSSIKKGDQMKRDTLLVTLRIFIGIIFFWFGVLKFFPGLSPAESLAITTMDWVFQGLIPGNISIKLLALLELLIAGGLILGIYVRYILPIFLFHMSVTFLPLFIFPEITFTHVPYGLTLEGQYIVKNIVFIALGLFLYVNRKKIRNKYITDDK